LPPLEELRATRERPLFSSRRKPDDEVAESETPVAQESPESLPFDLTGVVMGADVAIAILHNRETQETVHLRQGETVEAWSIGEIAPRHIVLRQDDRELRLELFQTKPEGSSGSPALAMPPPAMRPVARHAPPPPSAQAEVPQPRRNLQNNQSQRRSVRRGQQLRRNQNR
jgi:type II secretory pathway component PulC